MKKNLLLTMFALCFITFGFSQTDCGTALALTPGTPQAGVTAAGGSFPDGNGAPTNPCSSNYNDNEYWFQYTAVETGETLDLTITDLAVTYYGLFILDNCPGSTPTCVASDTNGNSTANLTVSSPALTAGTTYYIVLTEWAESSTAFTLNSVLNAAPTCTAAAATASVIRDCVVSGGFLVEVDVTDLGTATALTISDDQANPSQPLTALGTLTFGPYVNGTDVVITLNDDNDDDTCTVTLASVTQAACPPANDDCAFATALIVNPDYSCANPVSGTTIEATQSISGCNGTANDDVWYSFVATNTDHRITITNTSGSSDIVTQVFDACGGTSILCQDTPNSPIELTGLTPTNTYYFRIYTWSSTSSTRTSFDVCVGTLSCTRAVVDSSTVVDDCGASQFSVDVVVSDAGDGSVITDGLGGSFPITAGTVNAGPYTIGDVITLTVEHSGSDCDFELGDFESECTLPGEICENSIIIGALPYTTTDNTSNYGDDYGSADEPCSTSGYLTGDDVVYSFTPVTDMSVNMTTSGTGSWTGLFIYEQCPFVTCVDSDTQSSGNPSIPEVSLVGGTTYYIVISTYPSPQSTAYTLDITENTCTAASATFTVISDCIVSGGFLVEVDVTDLGTATALTISDDQANPSQPLTAIGTLTFGPYVNGTDVVITINDDNDDDSCTVTSSAITQAVCPPSNVDCANATPIACGETINATSVGSTGNSEDIGCSMGSNGLWFTFVGTGGDITVASTASFDHRQGIASGSCGSLVNIVCDDQSTGAESHTFTSVLNETYYVYIARYSSGSTVTGTISLTLTCAVVPTCTPADATATVVEDCVAETYVVNVDVTTVGNATEISDGIATYPISGTGIIAVGPYATGTPVTLNIVHDDADCDFTLGTYNFVCPPVNDDIMNPVKLEAGSAVCEDPVIGTNVGATDSVEAGASCGTPEGDVWFQIEIPNTGEITVETSSSGGISDTVMAIYSGMPGSLVEVDCDDDDGTGSFSSIALTGQTPGDIYYVRVWEYQNNAFGTFSICAWSPTTLSVDTNVIEGFSYYPNPVNNVLNVKAQTNISNVTVYNMLGQEVLRTAPNTVASEVDMSNLQTGAYFVKVTIGGATKTIRVIKN